MPAISLQNIFQICSSSVHIQTLQNYSSVFVFRTLLRSFSCATPRCYLLRIIVLKCLLDDSTKDSFLLLLLKQAHSLKVVLQHGITCGWMGVWFVSWCWGSGRFSKLPAQFHLWIEPHRLILQMANGVLDGC